MSAYIIGHALKASESVTVISALRIAAEVYREDAASCGAGNDSLEAMCRMRDQFIRQAKDCEALAMQLEDADVVQITTKEIES